jgi:hypothetical protein
MMDRILPLESKCKDMEITPEMAAEMLQLPIRCALKDCGANYRGEMPSGWRCIGVHKEDVLDWEIDGVLCPKHLEELGDKLTMGFKLSLVAAEVNRNGN